MNQDEFLRLYQRFLEGKCTPEEIDRLHDWEDDMQLEDGVWSMQPAEKEEIREAIQARLRQSMTVRGFRWGRFWRAAAIVAGLGIGSYYLLNDPERQSVPVVQHIDSTDAKKTWLTLGNGQRISLTDAANGVVSGAPAVKRKDGMLLYEFAETGDKSGIPDTNNIRTPYGARFALTLSDGSKVWLNAATDLRFPVYFNSDRREVYLTGEACFEVHADASKPFIVHVNGVAVRATGTLFNIKSYTAERHTEATLLEGKVHVTVAANTQVLKPNQQLWYDEQSGRSRVLTASAAEVLAWRDGWFAFKRETIAGIMHEIGRWYNKEIVFVKGDKYRRFSGKVERFDDLNEVLTRLEGTGAMQFETTRNKIMVTIP